MTANFGNLTQAEIDELFKKNNRVPCGKCEDRKIEIKAVQRTLNTMLNQAASELESVKKENERLRMTIEKMAKD